MHAPVLELEERERKQLDRIEDLTRLIHGKESEKLTKRKPPKAMRGHGRGGRHSLPSHLRCRRVMVNLPTKEKKGLVEIHRQYRHHYEYEPASLLRVLQVIPVYVDPKKKRAPKRAPFPPRVIPQAGAGPGLLAHLLVAKYVDDLPLTRQSAIFSRAGVKLARQKLCNWVEHCAGLLQTIYQQLAEMIRASFYIQADETPVPIRDKTKPGKIRKGYFWVYLSPEEEAVIFDCRPSRHSSAVERFVL